MSSVATILGVLGVYLAAAVTPGPNVVLIIRTASAGSRRAALSVAGGVVTAGALLAALAELGLGALLAESVWLQRSFRILCGLYLAYLGTQMWRHSGRPLDTSGVAGSDGLWSYYRQGILTNITNPKAAIFFGSILTVVLPPSIPLLLRVLAIVAIVVSSALWHTIVALVFSTRTVQNRYFKAKPALDSLIGTVFLGFGAGVVIDEL